jgi:hypothetical protein
MLISENHVRPVLNFLILKLFVVASERYRPNGVLGEAKLLLNSRTGFLKKRISRCQGINV